MIHWLIKENKKLYLLSPKCSFVGWRSETEWRNEWKDGEMDGRMDGWMNELIDRCMEYCIDELVNEWMHEYPEQVQPSLNVGKLMTTYCKLLCWALWASGLNASALDWTSQGIRGPTENMAALQRLPAPGLLEVLCSTMLFSQLQAYMMF